MLQQRAVPLNAGARTWIIVLMIAFLAALTLVIWYYWRRLAVPAITYAQSPYHSVGMPASAHYYYETVWGIDNLVLRVAASGNLIRFSYRVTNVQRASELGNKRAKPLLIDPKRNIALEIPVMEQVGPLWQTVGLANGKEYWMTFSNKGGPVHRGDRVSVVIGDFHADGLLVE